MSLAAGNRLGPYEIPEPIGAGSMGDVWKARDTRLNRIKQLKGKRIARFELEAHVIAAHDQVVRPHVTQITDIRMILGFIEVNTYALPNILGKVPGFDVSIASSQFNTQIPVNFK